MHIFFKNNRVVFATITTMLIAPIYLVRDIPLYDLPAHIARQHVLFGEPSLYYAPLWRLVPNLAIEVWVAAFHRILGIDGAVRLFLAVTVSQLFWGALALNRVLFNRTQSKLILVVGFFVYSGPFLFGFVNLCFGLGMSLWVTAAWIKWREKRYSPPIFIILSCLILVCHLFAFAVYSVVIVSFQIDEYLQRRNLRRTIIELSHLLVPIGLYLQYMPRSQMLGTFVYNPIDVKFGAIYSSVGLYDPNINKITLSVIFVAIILGWRSLIISPRMRLPLVALILAFFLLPHSLGEGSFVDFRMPTTFGLFACASLNWRQVKENHLRMEGLIAAFLVARLALMTAQWHYWQNDFAEYRNAFSMLPPGAKLLPLTVDPAKIDSTMMDPPLGHIDALAVIERGALVPGLFAGLTHEVLIYRDPYKQIATQTPSASLLPKFDFILLLRPSEFNQSLLPKYTIIAQGRTFILGKLTSKATAIIE